MFVHLNDRLLDVKLHSANQAISWHEKFDKEIPDGDNLFTKEFLNGVGTAAAVLGSAAGKAAVVLGPLGGLVNGVLQGIILAMGEPAPPKDLEDIADLQECFLSSST